MTEHEVERFARSVACDLRLDPRQRYELTNAARKFHAMDDDELRATAQAMGTRSTNPVLGGAYLLLATGITASRFGETLSAPEREKYEDSLTMIGASSGTDSGGIEVELAEAAAHAADLERRGDMETATAIRAAVAREQQRRADEE